MSKPNAHTQAPGGRAEIIDKLHAAGYLTDNNAPTDEQILEALDQVKAATRDNELYNRLFPSQPTTPAAKTDDDPYYRLFPRQP